jgi:hypothetical protein
MDDGVPCFFGTINLVAGQLQATSSDVW